MSEPLSRRHFVGGLAAGAAAAEFNFLGALPHVADKDTQLNSDLVRFNADIEPLVRLLEETPREKLFESVAEKIKGGTNYQQLLTATFLAAIRGVQPRPVGFKFHAVLVINSAHLASQAASDKDRWLPLFWSMDNFKLAQVRNKAEGDWRMSAVTESKLPPFHQAKARFTEAMDAWDEDGADAAVTSFMRDAGAIDVVETFWRYGARDFRDIGHKAIYVANAWRTLQAIGWRYAEPVIRSLAYALLDRGKNDNPAKNNYEADIPGRENLSRLKKIRKDWQKGTRDDEAAKDLFTTLRTATASEASEEVVRLLNKNIDPASVWDGLFLCAGEQLMRQPGIVGLHCLTTANALHFAYQNSGNDETRRYVTLQASAFLTLFRKAMTLRKDLLLDKLDPADAKEVGTGDILADVSKNREQAARKTLAYLGKGQDAEKLMAEARRLIFSKGTDSHDYKFSSAVLEDFYHVSPAWRPRFLAASMFWLKGAQDRENGLIERVRSALA
jgi:hypothetical protein